MVCNSKTFYKTSPLYLPGFEFLSLKQDKELSKQEIKKNNLSTSFSYLSRSKLKWTSQTAWTKDAWQMVRYCENISYYRMMQLQYFRGIFETFKCVKMMDKRCDNCQMMEQASIERVNIIDLARSVLNAMLLPSQDFLPQSKFLHANALFFILRPIGQLIRVGLKIQFWFSTMLG